MLANGRKSVGGKFATQDGQLVGYKCMAYFTPWLYIGNCKESRRQLIVEGGRGVGSEGVDGVMRCGHLNRMKIRSIEYLKGILLEKQIL